MKNQKWIVALSLLLASAPAFARPRVRVVVHPPRPAAMVVVRAGAWAVNYRPAPRPGWYWVDGQYDARGVWVPGYWSPNVVREGYAWVPGHWVYDQYVEGYWREAYRPGAMWVEGAYDQGGVWVPGYWAPAGPPGRMAAPPPGAVQAPPAEAYPPYPDEAPQAEPAPETIYHDYE